MTNVSPHERAALLSKYRLLLSLRQRKDQDAAAVTSREELRALAREFPGALRELDLLGATELRRRVQVLERLARFEDQRQLHGPEPGEAKQGDEQEEWISWITTYHAWMRAALLIKGAAGRARQLTPEAWARAQQTGAAARSSAVTITWDEAFAQAVLRPRSGRLAVVVLEQLARQFGVSARRISQTLFPPRRSPPYTFSS